MKHEPYESYYTQFVDDDEKIPWDELAYNQLGVRMMIYLGADDNGNDYGDPPTLMVDICYECYENDVRGNETEWTPTIGTTPYAVVNGVTHSYLRQGELFGRTFTELFNEGEYWEWWDNCSEVFRYSGYRCNECAEELLEGVWDFDPKGKERPSIWHDEYKRPVKI